MYNDISAEYHSITNNDISSAKHNYSVFSGNSILVRIKDFIYPYLVESKEQKLVQFQQYLSTIANLDNKLKKHMTNLYINLLCSKHDLY